MGRYADTAVGELKLTSTLAHAVCAVIGEERGRDSVVTLTKAEVQDVLHALKHTVLVYQFKAFESKTDDRHWYLSHLNAIPRRVQLLEDWLRSGEDSMVFG